VGKRPPQVSQL